MRLVFVSALIICLNACAVILPRYQKPSIEAETTPNSSYYSGNPTQVNGYLLERQVDGYWLVNKTSSSDSFYITLRKSVSVEASLEIQLTSIRFDSDEYDVRYSWLVTLEKPITVTLNDKQGKNVKPPGERRVEMTIFYKESGVEKTFQILMKVYDSSKPN